MGIASLREKSTILLTLPCGKPGGKRPTRDLRDFQKAVIFCQPFGLTNRSVFELMGAPPNGQVRRPIVFSFPAAHAEGDGPTGVTGLLARFQRFGERSDLVHLQEQRIT